jgi:hypothetical protein
MLLLDTVIRASVLSTLMGDTHSSRSSFAEALMVQIRLFLQRHPSLISAVIVACGLLFLSKNIVARYDIWQHHRVWSQQHLMSYRYILSVSSMGRPDLNHQILVEVHNNQPALVLPKDGQLLIRVAEQADESSIDGLFHIMEDAINRRVDRVHVDYDPHLSYPIEISVDPSVRQVDDEIHYSIRNFEILP